MRFLNTTKLLLKDPPTLLLFIKSSRKIPDLIGIVMLTIYYFHNGVRMPTTLHFLNGVLNLMNKFLAFNSKSQDFNEGRASIFIFT